MLDFNNIEDRKAFAASLKNARVQNNLTQKELAEMLNVKRETVTQWESAKNLPEYGALSNICKILNIDYSHLFGEYFETKFIFREIKKVFGIPENAIKKLYLHDRSYIELLSWLISSCPDFDNLITTLIALYNSYAAAAHAMEEMKAEFGPVIPGAASAARLQEYTETMKQRDIAWINANKHLMIFLSSFDKECAEVTNNPPVAF